MERYHDLHHPSSAVTTMNDPHVEALHYRLVSDETEATFDAPPAREADRGAFQVRLADGILTVTMTDHHATEASARAQIEPYLRAWSIKTALDYPRLLMQFDYIGPTIVDRDPPPAPPGSVVVPVQPLRMSVRSLQARVPIGPAVPREYPEPPVGFLASPDVEALWQRYDGYVHTREPLLTMAYFCLTVLERSARDWPTFLTTSNSRGRAAAKYS